VTFNLLGESAISSSGGNIGVYTNHRDTIERIREYFDKLWKNSVDAGERLKEISLAVNKEVLKDGEEGLKKYFERLSGMGMGHFAIESSEPDRKTLVIVCTDPAKTRLSAKKGASGNICESVRGAFKSFGEFIYQGTKMDCEEVSCVGRGDDHCEFRLYPLELEKMADSDLLKFFESIKSERSREQSKVEN
jgi:predicted hydrocarbon binding protein